MFVTCGRTSLKVGSPINIRGRMAALDSFEPEFEDLPKNGRKKPSIIKEIKEEAKMLKYNKTRTEHHKDIVIAMLIVGIIAFVAGARL